MDTPDANFDHRDAPVAPLILSALVERWADGATLGPDTLELDTSDCTDDEFIRSVQFLNDHGFITIEALMIGVYPRPIAVDAFITRRGRHLLDILTALKR